jgi:hypothetical protein
MVSYANPDEQFERIGKSGATEIRIVLKSEDMRRSGDGVERGGG